MVTLYFTLVPAQGCLIHTICITTNPCISGTDLLALVGLLEVDVGEDELYLGAVGHSHVPLALGVVVIGLRVGRGGEGASRRGYHSTASYARLPDDKI